MIKATLACIVAVTMTLSCSAPMIVGSAADIVQNAGINTVNSGPDRVSTKYKDNIARFDGAEYGEIDGKTSTLSAADDYYFASGQADIFSAMKINDAWDISGGDDSIVVAVLDSGIDFNHPDLTGHILSNGYDFVNNDSDPSDDNGHGTKIAGIIAATANNAIGISGAANCSILPVKIVDSTGSGRSSDMVKGIIYAVNNGANIINISIGTTTQSLALQNAVNYACKGGVTVIAASGNSGNGIVYPAACDNVIAVGAVTGNLDLASYSCYGSALDVTAVGSDVMSTCWNNGKSTYAKGTGTSCASPYVAALAALTLSVKADLTPSEIESYIKDSAIDLGTTGWDQYYGYGCVDFYSTLNALAEAVSGEDAAADSAP